VKGTGFEASEESKVLVPPVSRVGLEMGLYQNSSFVYKYIITSSVRRGLREKERVNAQEIVHVIGKLRRGCVKAEADPPGI
jgi:hypothetical protein